MIKPKDVKVEGVQVFKSLVNNRLKHVAYKIYFRVPYQDSFLDGYAMVTKKEYDEDPEGSLHKAKQGWVAYVKGKQK